MKKLDQPDLIYTDVIRINAILYGDKPAVICGDRELSWKDFGRRVNQVANALIGVGLKKGDKVCLLMNSSIEMFELLWGVVSAGGVVVPLNVMMAEDSLGHMINNSDAQLVFTDAKTAKQVDDAREGIKNVPKDGFYCTGDAGAAWRSASGLVDAGSTDRPPVKILPSDSMSIIYSSGSTGVPKGIEHSHAARHLYSLGFGPMLEINRFSVSICTTPLYTNGTWITMLPSVYWGATTVLLPKFSAEGFLGAVQRYGCTHMFAVPTQYIVIVESGLAEKYDVSSMKCLLTGGQAISTRTYKALEQQFPLAGIYECYGCTEGFVTISTPRDRKLPGKFSSVGLPIFGGETVVIGEDDQILPRGETGEICGWGPNLMKGYYNAPERTDEAVWIHPDGRAFFRSGDVGRMDEDAYVYVVGRVKDMIKSGGVNVFACDIEEVFMRHPEVVEATAIGIPHEKWVETPLLLAIMREGSTITESDLMAWGNERLGKWQRVSAVEYRTEFPRATHDKVLKRVLRDPFWKKA